MSEAEMLRIKCAELMGWTECRPRASIFTVPWISGINPRQDEIVEVIPCDGSPPRPPEPGDYGKPETLPDYLNDIAAAMTLADALVIDNWKCQIESMVEERDGKRSTTWTCTFGWTYAATSPSLAVAVCMAFVKVKERSTPTPAAGPEMR